MTEDPSEDLDSIRHAHQPHPPPLHIAHRSARRAPRTARRSGRLTLCAHVGCECQLRPLAPVRMERMALVVAAHRVGVMTTANMPNGSSDNAFRTGRANAAVLPLPVGAHPITSSPRSAAGMQFACTGVGCFSANDSHCRTTQGATPSEVQDTVSTSAAAADAICPRNSLLQFRSAPPPSWLTGRHAFALSPTFAQHKRFATCVVFRANVAAFQVQSELLQLHVRARSSSAASRSALSGHPSPSTQD